MEERWKSDARAFDTVCSTSVPINYCLAFIAFRARAATHKATHAAAILCAAIKRAVCVRT